MKKDLFERWGTIKSCTIGVSFSFPVVLENIFLVTDFHARLFRETNINCRGLTSNHFLHSFVSLYKKPTILTSRIGRKSQDFCKVVFEGLAYRFLLQFLW